MTTTIKLVAVLMAVALLIGAYGAGRMDGKMSCSNTSLSTYQKGVQQNEATEKSVKRLSTNDLDRVLLNWVQPDDTE